MVSSSSSYSSSSSSDLLRSSLFSSSVFSVFLLCSLELHNSQMQKKPSSFFSFLFFSPSLSLLGVFPFVFKSFLFNSHQIKPSLISSSLIVYLFIFGLCFVFSFYQLKPLSIFFFSCVFFWGGSWLLLADQMDVYTWTMKQTYSWNPRLHTPRLSKFSNYESGKKQ